MLKCVSTNCPGSVPLEGSSAADCLMSHSPCLARVGVGSYGKLYMAGAAENRPLSRTGNINPLGSPSIIGRDTSNRAFVSCSMSFLRAVGG